MQTQRPATARCARRAFSIIELLTVIGIIALLIAILVPTLAGVRTAGRKAATQSLLTELVSAASKFELDNRRKPGYFAMSELGSETNFANGSGPGLTYMENALLELSGAGAVRTEGPSDNPDLWNGGNASDWVVVNPTGDPSRDIWVKADLIGSDEGNYFLPDAGSLVHMRADIEQQLGTITSNQPNNASLPDGLPDLVDSFETPVLAWIEDPSVPDTITDDHDFASPSSDVHTSKFYWTANGSMLSSHSLGEHGLSMELQPANGGSLIGVAAYDLGEHPIEGVMAAMLGHPGYPDEATLHGGGYDDVFPKRARGGFIAHSAGADAMYLAADDKRAGRVLSSGMVGPGSMDVRYGIDFFAGPGGDRRKGENGQPVTADFLDGFDDLVVSE
ncbi:MAG: hypothetical protein H6810_05195 [Phycisphaeraceae bacterium]|nr:MAG: hypothetical protein H6810_05195 [Phycisphaeraceae bacterium]